MIRHLSRQELARFAKASCPPEEASSAYAHLVSCPECFRDYVALVGWSSWVRSDPLPAATVRARPPRRVAAVAVVLVAIALFARADAPPRFVPAPALARAVGQVSLAGFVLPGAEPHGAAPGAVYRSGALPGNVADALARALEASRDRPACPDAASWVVAGLLAADRLDEARLRAERGCERFPDDPRFPLLRAAVAYRESRLGDVERFLDDALAMGPQGVAARFDLALLLSETDREREAAEVAAALVASAPESLPGRRAEELLASLR